jgi:YHS domain-containing protein
MHSTRFRSICLALSFTLLLSADEPTSDRPALAIDGFCAVSLVSPQRLLRGSAAVKTIHEGVEYRFSSLRQKSVFLKDPETYTDGLAARYAKVKKSTVREGSGSRREGSGSRKRR